MEDIPEEIVIEQGCELFFWDEKDEDISSESEDDYADDEFYEIDEEFDEDDEYLKDYEFYEIEDCETTTSSDNELLALKQTLTFVTFVNDLAEKQREEKKQYMLE